jgi:hypothetical protein
MLIVTEKQDGRKKLGSCLTCGTSIDNNKRGTGTQEYCKTCRERFVKVRDKLKKRKYPNKINNTEFMQKCSELHENALFELSQACKLMRMKKNQKFEDPEADKRVNKICSDLERLVELIKEMR